MADSTTLTMAFDCGHGCPPIHMTLPLEPMTCADGHTHMMGTDAGQRRLAMAMGVHLRAVHGHD